MLLTPGASRVCHKLSSAIISYKIEIYLTRAVLPAASVITVPSYQLHASFNTFLGKASNAHRYVRRMHQRMPATAPTSPFLTPLPSPAAISAISAISRLLYPARRITQDDLLGLSNSPVHTHPHSDSIQLYSSLYWILLI